MGRVFGAIKRVFSAIGRGVAQLLNVQIGRERKEEPIKTLYHRPMPPRLQWNWPALVLGPFWYLGKGLWVHASILLSLVLLSGGLMIPFVWLYAGLKANEDLLDMEIARRNYS